MKNKNIKIKNILLSKVKKFSVPEGNVFHAVRKKDLGFDEFGEVYFSWIKYNKIKAWKKHKKATLNLLVPIGKVCFIFINNKKIYKKIIIGQDYYNRITVPPGFWFGFKGISKKHSLVMSLSNIMHNSKETENCPVSSFDMIYSFK